MTTITLALGDTVAEYVLAETLDYVVFTVTCKDGVSESLRVSVAGAFLAIADLKRMGWQ